MKNIDDQLVKICRLCGFFESFRFFVAVCCPAIIKLFAVSSIAMVVPYAWGADIVRFIVYHLQNFT